MFRTAVGLGDLVRRLDAAQRDAERRMAPDLSDASEWRRFNLVTVSLLVARAALRREESRGGHFREDFPARDDLHWKVHLVDSRPGPGAAARLHSPP